MNQSESKRDSWFESVEKGWEITSRAERAKLIADIEKEVRTSSLWKIDEISEVDDYSFLPVSLQGYLLLAFNPDGWNVEDVRNFLLAVRPT